MSPINEISDIVRMPRLGKIHLGIKVQGTGRSPYPKATDYFVCPPEVQEVYGEKPTMLNIMFPVDAPEVFAQQWLRSYSRSQGLVCIGDGLTSKRKVDIDSGDIASGTTEEGRWQWQEELPCDPQECPQYLSKLCRRVMNLQFLLPEVPGLGVWQIDTTSFHSIVNINSMVKMLRGMVGRCSMVPLQLCLGPVQVSPEGKKTKTVYILHINKNIKLGDMARLALLPPARALIPEPDGEEIPAGLFPDEVLEQGEEIVAEAQAAEKPAKKKAKRGEDKEAKTPVAEEEEPAEQSESDKAFEALDSATTKKLRDPHTLTSLHEMLQACHADFGLQPSEVFEKLEVKSRLELTDPPSQCYIIVRGKLAAENKESADLVAGRR